MGKKPYDKIYLIGWYPEYPRPGDFGDEVTWCQDQIGENDECPDIEYIRADLADEKLTQANQRIAECGEIGIQLLVIASELLKIDKPKSLKDFGGEIKRMAEALQPKDEATGLTSERSERMSDCLDKSYHGNLTTKNGKWECEDCGATDLCSMCGTLEKGRETDLYDMGGEQLCLQCEEKEKPISDRLKSYGGNMSDRDYVRSILELEAENKRLRVGLKGIRKAVTFIGYASTNKDEVDERVIELKGFVDALSKDKT